MTGIWEHKENVEIISRGWVLSSFFECYQMSGVFKSLFGQMCRLECENKKKIKKTSSWQLQVDQAHYSWRPGIVFGTLLMELILLITCGACLLF